MMMRCLALLLLSPPVIAAAPPPAPASPFAQQTRPPAPDYSRPESWAARPGSEGESALVPAGATPVARHPRADIFYIHPTTDTGHDHWNADAADRAIDHWTDISVIARQASTFNACCRIFAPRYRQASAAAFSARDEDRYAAYDLAYQDVARAFAAYIAHDNHGRPFILAGHSQGALLAQRLLRERIAGTPLMGRMVAAYIVGIGLPEGAFGREPGSGKACAGPNDTGCVIGWNSFLTGSDTVAYRARPLGPYRAKYGDAGATLLCSDPLTLASRNGATAAGAGTGALPGDPQDGPLQPLIPAAVTGRCENGVLMVTPAPSLGLKPLPGGSMHFHDFSMFYAEIRADAVRRVAAFLLRGKGSGKGE